ncbi:MAG TPA: amino acid adenylation domain-containing protein [Micromonosporaceae bacterium]|nr:amino acid adenylation domain-containing protein [Micromonosporaceae bacterium]
MLPAEPLVHRVFESHVSSHPERVALTYGAESYTYAELNARANQFAHYLLGRDVGKGCLVGVCLDRSLEQMVAILGTLKAGAGYVPLDVTYPIERLRQMTSELTAMPLVAASADTAGLVQGGPQDIVEMAALRRALDRLPTTDPEVAVGGEDVCYAVFTSGSTGRPKATAVKHQGWYNLLDHLADEFGLDHRSSNLMVSSFGFDISQRSLLTPLFTGATQHLLPSRHFDAMMACRLIREHGVRTLHCAPSTLYLLVERQPPDGPDDLDSIDHVFVGGEPLSARRVAGWAGRAPHRHRLVDVYGVAECTDVSTIYVLRDYERYIAAGVPIGRPVNNIDVYLLDDDLRQVAPGEVGEICICGVGVGVGYLNAPELNREKFVKVSTPDGYVDLYRTGDLGFVGPDGELRCVGRVDAQVKIRGMRIDLGDVETAVRRSSRVEDAAVVAVEPAGSAERELVAFVIPAAEMDERALRAELHSLLPTHMVPRQVVVVAGFPLSPNGKVDRKALARSLR